MYRPLYFLPTPNINNKKFIKCATLNTKTLSRRLHKLITLATKENLDIIFLQETKQNKGGTQIFKNYDLVYYGNSCRDGVGMLIKSWLRKYIIDITFYNTYLSKIEFCINSTIWTCVNFYGLSGGNIAQKYKRLNKLFSIIKNKNNICIFGDFNLKYNTMIKLQQTYFANFKLLSNNLPTFFYQNKNSVLDYILSRGNIKYKLHKNKKQSFTDHALVSISIYYDFFNFKNHNLNNDQETDNKQVSLYNHSNI